jgi:abequosyltransferase
MSYKLSICIPTYNRADSLPVLLDSIIKQVDISQPVEVCISDNASTDSTKELIAVYQKKYPHIVYFCWPENMGADRNYLKVVEIASGEYCWLIGSDDSIIDGAIKKVFEFINFKYDVILGDRIECDVNLQPICRCKCFPSARVYNLKSNDEFMQYVYQAKEIAAFFNYLSNIIFLRAKWSALDCDPRMIGSAYSQAYMLFKFSTYDEFKLFYADQPLVYYRKYDGFCSSDLAKKVLLDLYGFELIANLLFFNDPIKYHCLLWSTEKTVADVSMTFKGLLIKRFFSKESTFGFLQFYSQRLYGSKLRIKFFIINTLYFVPFLRQLVRRFVLFVYTKIYKRSLPVDSVMHPKTWIEQ